MRKLLTWLVASALVVAAIDETFALAAAPPPVPQAEGYTLSIAVVDYLTAQPLACGGSYELTSWAVIRAKTTAVTAGETKYEVDVFENDGDATPKISRFFSNPWVPREASKQLRTDWWPPDDGSAETYTFQIKLGRDSDPAQIVLVCPLTISRAPTSHAPSRG